MAAPRHVLLELDEQGDLHSVGEESDAEELGEGRNALRRQRGDPRSSSGRPSSAQDEPGRRRAISPEAVAQAPSRGGSRRRAATPVGAPLPAGVDQDPRTKKIVPPK